MNCLLYLEHSPCFLFTVQIDLRDLWFSKHRSRINVRKGDSFLLYSFILYYHYVCNVIIYKLTNSRSLNRDKDSFRSDGNCEEIIHCGNIFFEFIMKNSMFSLNLRKFLEEGCEFFDPSADQHGIFIQEEQ